MDDENDVQDFQEMFSDPRFTLRTTRETNFSYISFYITFNVAQSQLRLVLERKLQSPQEIGNVKSQKNRNKQQK